MTLKLNIVRLPWVLAAALLTLPACIWRTPSSVAPMELSLYSGVAQMANLGDTTETVVGKLGFAPQKTAVGDPDLVALQFTDMFDCSDLGVRIYFRRGRVGLLEFQEPFRGTIRGKKFALFPFAKPSADSWEDALVREFGKPVEQGSGGRLGSQSLFYSWGDISFNGLGPNEIAVYRDHEVAKYRQKNFGRVLKLFNQ